jgi:peptidyl-prolyl cis-trans isomerase B (cyclophilin B)
MLTMRGLASLLLMLGFAGGCATTPVAPQTSPATVPATAPAAAPAPVVRNYDDQIVELHTTAGEIHIRLYPQIAPNHVKNFVDLAAEGFYEGTKFHRVIPGFMIQGGDPNTKTDDVTSWGLGGSPKKLKAEFNAVRHTRGIVSMARASDPDSASTQFFIMVAEARSLDLQYSVFGEVTKGMEVVDVIVNASRNEMDRPNEPTTITKVVVRDARDDEKGVPPLPGLREPTQ